MRFKLLLSAYACEPKKGSEPGVGWHWALEAARLGYEVWVITRSNNRPSIEAESTAIPSNLRFIYYDPPPWMSWWKKYGRRAKARPGGRWPYLYYLLWQWGAYRVAKRAHARERFDGVQHVTFVSVRQPSFMGNLGIPFVFGPAAGGERAPWRLRWGYGFRGWVIDAFRDLMNLLVKFDPLMRRTFRKAERIYVTSAQTLALLPSGARAKGRIHLAIGCDPDDGRQVAVKRAERSLSRELFRVLYIGRFVYWKGGHLGLLAFAHLLKSKIDARLSLVGKGPDEARWRRLADKLSISEHIDWVPWVSREKLLDLYTQHTVFFFPSLHDSGGMVVLEAMTYGLPVVCLDLGGPGAIVNDSCGRVIKTADRNQTEVIRSLGEALAELAADTCLCSQLSQGALKRVQHYHWGSVVRKVWT
ncbi:MAG TPA: glycosyltransferase [Pyrinomonadaceae bacterium]|nr:glycosyltransferase [Pyrinomonadaceae bacterium]